MHAALFSVFEPVSNVLMDHHHSSPLPPPCTVQRPQPTLCHTVHSEQSIKIRSPSSPVCQSLPCKCVFVWGCVKPVCGTHQLSVFSVMLWWWCSCSCLYLYKRSLPPARAATLLTMSRPSTDSIWSDLRKRTGTITLFSFFRWVPSERRKEGRGEEVNKPSAFLKKNKETLDRHLHFSMK